MAIHKLSRAIGLFLFVWFCSPAAQAIDWMINEDYKQLDPRGASDFDILLQGNVGGQITGGGMSSVTNPFANPTRTTSTDAFGNTIVRFAGSNTIPADPNVDRHVGIYGTGPKPRVLVKAWSFATDPKRVPVPKSNMGFLYDSGQKTLRISIENTSPDTVTFSEVGYLLEARERPIEKLTRRFLPPDAFKPLPQLNGEYAPGTTASVEISGVPPSSFAISYATVRFSGPSSENDYTATGGEWAQVAVASQTLDVIKTDPDAAEVPPAGPGASRGLLLLLPLLPVLPLALRSRFRRSSSERSSLLGALFVGALIGLATAGPLAANVYVIKLLPPTPNDPRPKIEVNGIPMTIDTGCTPGLYATPATAGTLGLNTGAGTAGRSRGVGGSTPTTTGVPVPAGSIAPSGPSTPVTPQGQGATTPPMPTTATVGNTASPALLGDGWLSNFFYGRIDGYFWLVEKDQGGEGVATANSMALFLSGESLTKSLAASTRPPGTQSEVIRRSPAKVLPPGIQAADDGWILAVDVVDPVGGGTVADASFLIKSGLPMTLISDRLATQLGLDLASLPKVTTLGNFGPIQVRQAKLTLALFADPAFPVFTIPVGVTDPTTNPFGENFLSNDVLSSLFSWEISAVEGDGLTRFFAAP